jgi:hypothetical protein
MTTYKITCTFTEPMLGTAPTDVDIYKNFVVPKRLREAKKIKSEDAPALEATIVAKQEEEVALLPKPQDDEDNGITVFRHDGTGLILMDYMVRGFLKEAARSVSGIWGIEPRQQLREPRRPQRHQWLCRPLVRGSTENGRGLPIDTV